LRASLDQNVRTIRELEGVHGKLFQREVQEFEFEMERVGFEDILTNISRSKMGIFRTNRLTKKLGNWLQKLKRIAKNVVKPHFTSKVQTQTQFKEPEDKCARVSVIVFGKGHPRPPQVLIKIRG
jgi:hypothetical protein